MQIPDGQLSNVERDYLFNLVVSLKPNLVIESGTWQGGGSTLFLVKALFENKAGQLHTYETYTPYWECANNFYEQSVYKPYISLFNEDFINATKRYNFEDNSVVIFLDGEMKHGMQSCHFLQNCIQIFLKTYNHLKS
jgi:hypothetical protein